MPCPIPEDRIPDEIAPSTARGHPDPARANDPAALLRHLELERHLADPAIKQRFVTPMFEVIAPRYDTFTRRFSLGMDRRWKRDLVGIVGRHAPVAAAVLDVACGTGDLSLAVAAARTDLCVTGMDVSHSMLALASARAVGLPARRVQFVRGDLARLPFRDASIDVITAGYAVRNAPARLGALRELARVLKPGGQCLTLDFFRPRFGPWRRAWLAYLATTGSLVGWLWHRMPVVYRYIARSIDHFVSWQAFAEELQDAGFEVRSVQRRLGGGIAIHHAVRR